MGQDQDGDGTSQPERLSPLLGEDQPLIDGLPPEARLAFSAQIAALLKYHDQTNQENGSFAPFFEADTQVALARIAAYRPGPLLRRIRGQLALSASSRAAGEDGMQSIAALLIPALATVDGWWRGLPAGAPVSFQQALKQTIQRDLSPLLSALLAAAPELATQVSMFDAKVWQISEAGQSWKGNPAVALDVVERSLSSLSAQARQALEQLARSQPAQAPHVALYQTIVQLLEHARARVNAFPERQLRFYVEQILRQAPRPPVPDRALVAFLLAPDAPATFLPAGTALSAGKDRLGQDRTYSLVADTLVDSAAVTRASVLYVRAPDAPDKLAPRQEVFFSTFEPGLPAPEPGVVPLEPGFPTFGTDPEAGAPYAERMAPAQVGFAISSPILQLEGGKRTVTIRIDLTPAVTPPPEPTLRVQLSGSKDWIDCNVQVRWERDSDDITRWTLALTLALGASQPAVAPYKAAALGPGFPDGPPVLRALLDQEATSVAGSGLSRAVVRNVTVSASVEGLRSLSLSSSSGPLLTGKPFPPLGYAPPLGAALLIGCPEAFQKPLRAMLVHLRWANLPVPVKKDEQREWFTAYYDGYQLALSDDPSTPASDAYTNSSFQVQLEYRQGGQWQSFNTDGVILSYLGIPPRQPCTLRLPAPDDRGNPPQVNLFLQDGAALCRTTTWALAAPDGQALNAPAAGLASPLSLDPPPDAGVLRVLLTAPAYGFGQAIYPQAAVALALLNAKQLIPQQQQQHPPLPPPPDPPPLPRALNLPYTPMLEDISLDYAAEASAGASVFQIGPLGTEQREVGSQPTLLPELSPGGTLFLGLQGFNAPNPVSCLFVLQDQAAPAGPGGGPQSIAWSYLGRNGWTPLPATESVSQGDWLSTGVVSDQTNGLTQSGIIKLLLPEDAIPWSGQPPELLWVRAQVTAPQRYAATQALLTQAAWCQRVVNPLGDQAYDVPLPSGSITALVDDNPSIAGVQQPLPSADGRRGEDTAALYARVSERCRHKARAVTPWDHERLVLQEFPWVFAARCLPQVCFLDGAFQTSAPPGSVLLLVRPRVYAPGDLTRDTYPPRIAPSRLEEIRAFLSARAPAAAAVQVMNPRYAQLTIHCVVKAAARQDPMDVTRRLNSELCALISPWIFGADKARGVAGPASIAEVRSFIKTRDYVAGILQLSSSVDGVDPGVEWLSAPDKPWLVQISAFQHDLKAMTFG